MPRNLRRSGSPARRFSPALALLLAVLAGCATTGGAGSSRWAPEEAQRALLGANPGLGGLRAVVEARFAFAGHEVSFPGVLLLQGARGFRLDLLDPLDRPAAMFFPEERRVVQYRPPVSLAASLAVVPEGCRNVVAGDWVAALLGGGGGIGQDERVEISSFWGRRSLRVSRNGELRQSVLFEEAPEGLRPTQVSWYCSDDPVLKVRFRSWRRDSPWRLPGRIEITYPRAGLGIRIDFKDVEANPGPTSQPVSPRLPEGTRWTVWNLLE